MSARIAIEGEVAVPQTLDFETMRALAEQLVEPSALLAGREIAAVRLDTPDRCASPTMGRAVRRGR